MRRSFKRALQRDDPPTLGQLTNRLGFKDKKFLTRYFPTLHAELLARRKFLKNTNKQKSVPGNQAGALLLVRIPGWLTLAASPTLKSHSGSTPKRNCLGNLRRSPRDYLS